MNIHHPLCPLDFVLELLSARWTALIVTELKTGPKRPSELARALLRISAKTLTQRLRQLEEAGFILRESYKEIPPRVIYSLTATGKDLVCVLEALTDMGARWQREIEGTSPESAETCRHCDNMRPKEDFSIDESHSHASNQNSSPRADAESVSDVAAFEKSVELVSNESDSADKMFLSVDKPQSDSFLALRPGDPRRAVYEKKMLENLKRLKD